MSALTGWELLHSPLPRDALKPLNRSVYGVSGLTDVNEGFLIERLWQSRLSWSWEVRNLHYCGIDVRTVKPQDGGKPYEVTYFLATIEGVLTIDGRTFGGAGAHDNRKIDAAAKGAATVAFKNACKLAGLTTELYKGGQMRDVVDRDDSDGPGEATNGRDSVHEPAPEEFAGLVTLAASLPKTPKDGDGVWVLESLKKYSYRSLRDALLHQHRGQCGENCEHVQSQPSLLPETAA